MSHEPFKQDHVQILDWFEGDASTFVPRPRTAPLPPGELGKAAAAWGKLRWLPILTQHTVPGEGGRLVVKKGDGCPDATVIVDTAIVAQPPDGGAVGKTYRGHEMSVDLPDFLVLWHKHTDRQPDTRDVLHEEVQYVPWEAVAAVSFSTRK